MIKLKLQDEEEGVGWDQQTHEEAEVEYRRFLALKNFVLNNVSKQIINPFGITMFK